MEGNALGRQRPQEQVWARGTSARAFARTGESNAAVPRPSWPDRPWRSSADVKAAVAASRPQAATARVSGNVLFGQHAADQPAQLEQMPASMRRALTRRPTLADRLGLGRGMSRDEAREMSNWEANTQVGRTHVMLLKNMSPFDLK